MTDRKKPDRKNSTSSEVNRYLKRREKLICGLENESFLVSESGQSMNMSKDSIFLEFLERKEKLEPADKKPAAKRRLFQTDLNNVEVRSNNSEDSQVRRNLLRKAKTDEINIEVDKSEISLVEIPEKELENGLSDEILKKVDQNVSLINASFRKNRFKPLENVKVVRARPKPNLKSLKKRRETKRLSLKIRKDSYWRNSPVQTRASQTLRNELTTVQEIMVPESMDIIYISSEEKPIEPVNYQFSWEKQNEEFSSLELPQVVMTPHNFMSQMEMAELQVVSRENEIQFLWNDSPMDVPKTESPIPENLPIGSPNSSELPEVVIRPENLPETQQSKNEEKPEDEVFFDPSRNEIEILNQSLEILNSVRIVEIIEKEDCSSPTIMRMQLPTPDLFTLSSENQRSLEPNKNVETPMKKTSSADVPIIEEVPVVVPDTNFEVLAEKTNSADAPQMIEEVQVVIVEHLQPDEMVTKLSSPYAPMIKEVQVVIQEKPIQKSGNHVSVIVPVPVVEPVNQNLAENKIQETIIFMETVPAEIRTTELERQKIPTVGAEKKSFVRPAPEKFFEPLKSNLSIFGENRLVSIEQQQIQPSLDSRLSKRPEPPKFENLVSIHPQKVPSSLDSLLFKRPEPPKFEKLVTIHQQKVPSSLDSHLFKRPEPPKFEKLVTIHQQKVPSSLDSHLFKRPEPPKIENKLVSIHQQQIKSSLGSNLSKRPEPPKIQNRLVSIQQPRMQSSLDSHLFKRPEPPKIKTKPKERLKSPYDVKPSIRPKTFGEKEKNISVQKESKKSRSANNDVKRLKMHFKKNCFFVEKIPVFKERVVIPEQRKEIVLARCDRFKKFDKEKVLNDEKLKRSQREQRTEKVQSAIGNEKKGTEVIHEMYKQLKKDGERRLERIRKLVPLSTVIKRTELKQNYLNKLSSNAPVFTAPKQKAVAKWILDEKTDDSSESLPNRLKDFDSVASAIDLW